LISFFWILTLFLHFGLENKNSLNNLPIDLILRCLPYPSQLLIFE
jgi:hypothetical protein